MPPLQPFRADAAAAGEPAGPAVPPPPSPGPQPGTWQAPGYGQAYGGYRPYGGYPAYPGQPGAVQAPGRDPALAEWWQRLLARLIDDLVLSVLVGPLWLAAFLPVWHRLMQLPSQSAYVSPAANQAYVNAVNQTMTRALGTFLLVAVAAGVISFGYDWLQHGLWGQTLGKRVMRTRVVRADTRTRISGGAACGRAAVYALVPLVPTAGGIFALLNELWLLWDPQRQCLHDKAARTVVIKADAAVPAQPNMS